MREKNATVGFLLFCSNVLRIGKHDKLHINYELPHTLDIIHSPHSVVTRKFWKTDACHRLFHNNREVFKFRTKSIFY